MDRGRFRSTGGRDDDYEGEAQYRDENEQYTEDAGETGNTENEAYEEYPDERERPVRKSRPSSSPVPRRSHNPSNSQGTYSTRREQQGTRRLSHPAQPAQPAQPSQPSAPSQPSRRESEDRRPQRDQQYERGEQQARRSQRPREDYYEETPRRLRASRPPVSRQTTRRRYSDEDERYIRSGRSASSVRRTQRIDDDSRRSSRPAKRRGGFSSLLGGCLLGIILTIIIAAGAVFYIVRISQGKSGVPIIGGGSATQIFQHSDTQTVTLSALSQLQICDSIGNVSVAVNPNATATTITTTKIVHATSQDNANQEFGRIGVAVQQPNSLPATPTCATGTSTTSGTPAATTPTATTGGTNGILTVQTAIPNSGSLLRSTSDAVNIQLTLSSQAFAGAASLPQLYVQAPIGDINVNGLSGVLNIRGKSVNVTVMNAKLINGSHIGTGQGNVTFNGSLASPQDTTTNASFIIQNEKGQIDITLPSTTNIVLTADTNVGTIHSDFPITPTADGNSASFHGPLNPSATIQSIAVLTLNVSTGNITIHKA